MGEKLIPKPLCIIVRPNRNLILIRHQIERQIQGKNGGLLMLDLGLIAIWRDLGQVFYIIGTLNSQDSTFCNACGRHLVVQYHHHPTCFYQICENWPSLQNEPHSPSNQALVHWVTHWLQSWIIPWNVISGATNDIESLAGHIMSHLINKLIVDPSIEHLVDRIAPKITWSRL